MTKPEKPVRLPLYFIALFSLALIAGILYTRNQADNSIKQLRRGSHEAEKIFYANQLLDGLINDVFIAESTTGEKQKRIDPATVDKIKKDATQLDQLFQNSEIHQQIKSFKDLVWRLMDSLQNADNNNAAKNLLINETVNKIYSTALSLEENFGRHLETNIKDNEQLANRVLQLDIILTITIILTIALLATIIILYLVRNIRLLRQVQIKQEEVKKAAAVKEQFLANMSHEIRTPVNAVIGFANLLLKSNLESRQHMFVTNIKNAGDNLLTIVNDILDISKIEAGMLHFDKSAFSVQEVCYQVETMLYQKATEKGIDIITHIEESVPEIVKGDKERLAQILINLTSNAIKFTSHGSVTISVKAQMATKGAVTLSFSIKDTGIGIATDKLDTIFQRFEQAEQDTTRKYGGTGLGLAIVKNLVELQGGTVGVNSIAGKGSDFYFTIPYEIGNDMELSYISQSSKNSINENAAAKAFPSHVQILAAEDNKMNQMLLKMLLNQWNLEPDIVENGAEAIEKLRKKEYDVVLMDIQMPVMDGYTAAQKIKREMKLSVPVIAMTANVLPGEKEKCAEMGMSGYISKPLNEAELYSILMLNTWKREDVLNNTENMFINKEHLNRLFSNNNTYIQEMLKQFVIQYDKEINELEQAYNHKNISEVNKLSHHIKTTLGSMNAQSPLLVHLNAMENADGSITGWNIIEYNINVIFNTKDEVLNEAKLLLAEI